MALSLTLTRTRTLTLTPSFLYVAGTLTTDQLVPVGVVPITSDALKAAGDVAVLQDPSKPRLTLALSLALSLTLTLSLALIPIQTKILTGAVTCRVVAFQLDKVLYCAHRRFQRYIPILW